MGKKSRDDLELYFLLRIIITMLNSLQHRNTIIGFKVQLAICGDASSHISHSETDQIKLLSMAMTRYNNLLQNHKNGLWWFSVSNVGISDEHINKLRAFFFSFFFQFRFGAWLPIKYVSFTINILLLFVQMTL